MAEQRAHLEVGLLGPLRLVVEGEAVDVPGPKRRAVLALLAMAEGRVVSAESLVDALWPSEPPDSARATLQSHVSRLRRHLGAAASRLQSTGGGYRLLLDEGAMDVSRARILLGEARRLAPDDPRRAYRLLGEARTLWRGDIPADLSDVLPIAAWSAGLDELRRDIDDMLVECALGAGDAGSALPLALEAAAADPFREPAVLLLMRAQAATGRASQALRTGYEYRRRLAEETGLDPSAALGELEREIAGGASAHRRGVPAPTTRLVGRDSELATLHRLLEAERLVTVVGPGGVGKTRLAIEVARRKANATMLPLAPVTDPAAIRHALAEALDLRGIRGDVMDACVALLASGPHLLLIDNCEHLLDAVRDVVETLLGGCPELRVLATSREVLGTPAESPCRLSPLALPDAGRGVDPERAPAVAVFLECARRVRPHFTPTKDELRVVADIVRRLDGVPLAIELAAGRLSSFGLADLHSRLDRSLDLLGGGGGTDVRHRSLRATLEWSYDLLPPHEQRLFRHLAIFPDGVDLSTAESVAAALEMPDDTAQALAHLVDASMIEVDFAGGPRYRMLETLRSFGLDRLAAAGEEGAAADRMMRWALDLSAWIDVASCTQDEPLANEICRRELPNLRAAWRHARETGRTDDAVDLVIALAEVSGSREMSEVWSWAVELVEEDETPAAHPRWATVVGIASVNEWMRGNQSAADSFARRALELAEDGENGMWSQWASALVALSAGAYDDAVTHAVEAFELSRRPTDRIAVGAIAALYGGDVERAKELNARLEHVAASPSMRAMYEYAAGEIENATGNLDAAEHHYGRAIELSRISGATFVAGIASVGLLTLQAKAGRVEDALRGYSEVIDYWERAGIWTPLWTTLRNLAELLDRMGDSEAALFLTVAADHAPEASAASDESTRDMARMLDSDSVARIESEGASSTRARVLEVARSAIGRHLGPARVGGGV